MIRRLINHSIIDDECFWPYWAFALLQTGSAHSTFHVVVVFTMPKLSFASHVRAASSVCVGLLAVGFALSHCGIVVRGVETDPSRVDPFPRQGDGAVVVIGPDASVDDVVTGDASPFEGLDGRVRRDDPRFGRLFFSRSGNRGAANNSVLAATFWRLERMPSCTVYSDGPFNFSNCPSGAREDDLEAIPRAHSGSITVSSRGFQSEFLIPNRMGTYPDNQVNRQEFGRPGTVLQFTSLGAEVPAFNGTVTVPRESAFRVVAPANGDVVMGMDFTVAWNPSAGQFAYVLVQQTFTEAGVQRTAVIAAYLPCREGQVTFPARVTRRLHAGGDSQAFVYVATINVTSVEAGLWPIDLQAYLGEFEMVTVR